MATQKRITPPALLRDEDERQWRYSGTRSELIAAGLAQDGDFPGDPGAPVCTHTVNRDGRKLHFSVHSRIAQPTTFWCCIRKPRLARAPDPPSQAEIDQQEREDALNEAIDAGEDLGVIRRDWAWGAAWIGTRNDLIGAKVCEDRHLPVRPKRAAHGGADGRLGVESWSTNAKRRGYFEHRVWWDSETREARETQRVSPREDDPQALSDQCERWLMVMRNVFADMMLGVGYAEGSVRYDAQTIEKVSAALDHARQLLQASVPQRPRVLVRPDTTAAKCDTDFQRFIASTLKRDDDTSRAAD